MTLLKTLQFSLERDNEIEDTNLMGHSVHIDIHKDPYIITWHYTYIEVIDGRYTPFQLDILGEYSIKSSEELWGKVNYHDVDGNKCYHGNGYAENELFPDIFSDKLEQIRDIIINDELKSVEIIIPVLDKIIREYHA